MNPIQNSSAGAAFGVKAAQTGRGTVHFASRCLQLSVALCVSIVTTFSSATSLRYDLVEPKRDLLCQKVASVLNPPAHPFIGGAYEKRAYFKDVVFYRVEVKGTVSTTQRRAIVTDIDGDGQLETLVLEELGGRLLETTVYVWPGDWPQMGTPIDRHSDWKELKGVIRPGEIELTKLTKKYPTGHFGKVNDVRMSLSLGHESTYVNDFSWLKVDGQLLISMRTMSVNFDTKIEDPKERKWLIVGRVNGMGLSNKQFSSVESSLQDQVDQLCYFVLKRN